MAENSEDRVPFVDWLAELQRPAIQQLVRERIQAGRRMDLAITRGVADLSFAEVDCFEDAYHSSERRLSATIRPVFLRPHFSERLTNGAVYAIDPADKPTVQIGGTTIFANIPVEGGPNGPGPNEILDAAAFEVNLAIREFNQLVLPEIVTELVNEATRRPGYRLREFGRRARRY